MKKHFKISELSQQTEEIYRNGQKRGEYVGFDCLKDIFSVMLGSTLYMYGSPFSGKTDLKEEILINLSTFYGWKHAVFSPETGTARDVAISLIEKVAQKDFHNEYSNKMSESEKTYAEQFVDEHFFIIDPGADGLTLKGFFREVSMIEQEEGIKIHTTSIDPWDDMEHIFSDFHDVSKDTDYLVKSLKFIRNEAVQNNRYNIITTHVRDQQLMNRDGFSFYPPPTPREVSGGQVWFRKGMTMVGIWRPPSGMSTGNEGEAHQWNEVHFIPHKQKPKGVAIPGKKPTHGVLYFDPKRHRYYENIDGENHFASKDQERLKPSFDFDDVRDPSTTNDKNPFDEFD